MLNCAFSPCLGPAMVAKIPSKMDLISSFEFKTNFPHNNKNLVLSKSIPNKLWTKIQLFGSCAVHTRNNLLKLSLFCIFYLRIFPYCVIREFKGCICSIALKGLFGGKLQRLMRRYKLLESVYSLNFTTFIDKGVTVDQDENCFSKRLSEMNRFKCLYNQGFNWSKEAWMRSESFEKVN